MSLSNITQLIDDLKNLGINQGDVVMVHSSLRSVGLFENSAKIVTEALLNVIGTEGTLLMPALTYRNVTELHPVFDHKNTPSCVGALTEYFRCQPKVVRSLHPTHSVCAAGRLAVELTQNHQLDETPCGPNSPFRKLNDYNGKILFLGCGAKPNTLIHAVEELLVPPYLFGPERVYTMIPSEGSPYTRKYITHGFSGFRQHYDRIIDYLDPTHYSVGTMGKAQCILVNASSVWETAYQMLKSNPFALVEMESA